MGCQVGVAANNGEAMNNKTETGGDRPGYIEVMGESFYIVQDFVSRVRLAADPVDLLIVPDVAHIGVMEFHRAEESIDAGRKAVASAQDAILQVAQSTQLKVSNPTN